MAAARFELRFASILFSRDCSLCGDCDCNRAGDRPESARSATLRPPFPPRQLRELLKGNCEVLVRFAIHGCGRAANPGAQAPPARLVPRRALAGGRPEPAVVRWS